MKQGYLSEFFSGVAIKSLSAVEADTARSNQHEFNGVADLIRLFGRAETKQIYKTRFIYLNDGDDEPVVDDATLTWYDAREKHPTRSEHRLYFPTTRVSLCAAEGDLLVIGRRQDDSVLVIIAQGGSTIANQVQWLFSVTPAQHHGFSVREELETEQDRVQFASTFILEQIGIVVETTEENYLDTMLQKFGRAFPITRDFSAYARSTLKDINAVEDPDGALMAWMEREEILFRTLEKHLLADRLSKGFVNDVDGFLEFSLSVQNRRKSRVGRALENHLEVVFSVNGIRYDRSAVTEGKSRPDFLFPGAAQYHDDSFSSVHLTMLGVKTTCKDRWRQVLSEARRIDRKHLLTLEAAISHFQTDEMIANNLQIVVPRILHATYSPQQAAVILDVAAFTRIVKDRQAGTRA
ncbi:MAG TPA: type II restriction endonuclease [Clostridia bacterium]|nr:type II restriction endonuclease [Clostridia bacterium]